MDEEKTVCGEAAPENINEEYRAAEEVVLPKRSRTRRSRTLLYVVLTLVIILAAAGGGIWHYYKYVIPEKYIMKAAANFERENYTAALNYYIKVLKINPEHRELFYNAAVCCERLGKTDEAIVFYKEHLADNEKDSRALSSLGWLYMKKGEYLEALRIFEEAEDKNRDRHAYWHLMS